MVTKYAQIKINGDRDRFPDGGQIVGNRIYNTSPRRTDNPVTTIDLVGASDWTIRGNLIADNLLGRPPAFGPGVGVVERNLVVK